MVTYSTISQTRTAVGQYRKTGKSIGFVPTMGALHDAHLALIRRSKKENDITACSIFVNPIQFNNPQDLQLYPRTLEKDLVQLQSEGVDLVFTPEPGEMYPEGDHPSIEIAFGRLDRVLEGKYRPGHFCGVAIVVKKLFEIIQPDRAYFGKKDYQQLLIIKYMTHTLSIPVEIIACETVREPDGLAMSSRNQRMTIGERDVASGIYDVLMYTKANAGKLPVKKLILLAIKRLNEIPGFRVEYLDIVHSQTLEPLHDWDDRVHALVCVAGYLGDIRLIDNMELFS